MVIEIQSVILSERVLRQLTRLNITTNDYLVRYNKVRDYQVVPRINIIHTIFPDGREEARLTGDKNTLCDFRIAYSLGHRYIMADVKSSTQGMQP